MFSKIQNSETFSFLVAIFFNLAEHSVIEFKTVILKEVAKIIFIDSKGFLRIKTV